MNSDTTRLNLGKPLIHLQHMNMYIMYKSISTCRLLFQWASTIKIQPVGLVQSRQILGHVHILCITVRDNRNICCQIFGDLLLKSAFERIFNVMQLILVKIKWHIKWKYLIQKFHDICLSYYSVVTPFTSAQLRRLPRHERNIRRKINKNIRKYRVYVEHVIRLLKVFKIIGSLYRHNRDEMGRILCLCANLCARRSLLLFGPSPIGVIMSKVLASLLCPRKPDSTGTIFFLLSITNRDEMGRILCLCANLCARRSLLLFDPWCILKVRSVFKNKWMFVMFSYFRLCVVFYYLLRKCLVNIRDILKRYF
jgi:hypothetical protein